MYYYAYGSNMDAERMREREVSFSERRPAVLKGYKLCFNKLARGTLNKGFANIFPSENDVVEGVLYTIPDEDIKKLDKCEGYPDHYSQIDVIVQCGEEQVEAKTYIANSQMVKEGLKPTRDYLAHLLAGRDLLSEDYYQKLLSVETLD